LAPTEPTETLDAGAFRQDIGALQSATLNADLPALAARGREIQKKWTGGDPVMFARLMESASAQLQSGTYDSALLATAKGFAEAGLSKGDALPLDLQAKLVLDSISCTFRDSKGAEERGRTGELTKEVQAFAAMWQRVRTAVNPDYKFSPSSVVVPTPETTLPDGSVISYTGMPPEMIRDPGERAKYVAALDARRSAYQERDMQDQLQTLDKMFASVTKRHLIATFTKPSPQASPVEISIAKYVTDSKIRGDVLALAGVSTQMK
jgi:hypothetical protein